MHDQIQEGIRSKLENRLDEQCRRTTDELAERAAMKPLIEQYLDETRGVWIMRSGRGWWAMRLGITHENGGERLGEYRHKSYIKVIDWALDQPIQVWPCGGVPSREDEEFRKEGTTWPINLEYDEGVGYWVAQIGATAGAFSQGRTVGEAVLMAFDALHELHEIDRETKEKDKPNVEEI